MSVTLLETSLVERHGYRYRSEQQQSTLVRNTLVIEHQNQLQPMRSPVLTESVYIPGLGARPAGSRIIYNILSGYQSMLRQLKHLQFVLGKVSRAMKGYGLLSRLRQPF
jgi:hypothetical protein